MPQISEVFGPLISKLKRYIMVNWLSNSAMEHDE